MPDEYAATLAAPIVAQRATLTPSLENTGETEDPSIPSAAYAGNVARAAKCRACFNGTEAIRAGRTLYLTQYPNESDARYLTRLVIAAFYNGYARTVLASVGLLLSEEPTFGDDMPKELVDLAENVDAQGTHVTVFTRKLATDGIVDGFAGILVEHSRAPSGKALSIDEEKRLGLRPYFLRFRTSDVLRELYETVNGVRTLTLLVLRATVQRRKGAFGVTTVVQYRTYTNDGGTIRYALYESNETGGKPMLVAGSETVLTNQTEIPWAPLVAGDEMIGEGFETGSLKPPLLDLADLNIQYHNSLTNNLSLQSLACVPTPVRIGAEPNEKGEYPPLILGPANTIEVPKSAVENSSLTPVYWLSPPIDVLAPSETTLASTKADMATMGAAFLSAETRAAETAEGKRIDSAASRATLASIARAVQDCLERAFGFMAKYRKLVGGSVKLNQDFTLEGVDSATLAVYLQATMDGRLSTEEFRTFAQTGKLPETFDPSDVSAIMKENARQQQQLDAESGDGADNTRTEGDA